SRGGGTRIDEQRTRERLVRTVRHGLNRRQNRRSVRLLDRHGTHALRVRNVIREAEITERVYVVLDALYEHVVVLACRVVAAARLRLADDRFGEVIERS